MDITAITPIVSFLNSVSFIYKPISNGSWIQMLCPMCDDASRKPGKITHGHFYVSRYFNYCHCFRCDYSNSLSKTLVRLGFNDKSSLKELTKNNTDNFSYVSNKFNTTKNKDYNIKSNLINYYCSQNINILKPFSEYIYTRCLDIDPIDFLLLPRLQDQHLLCSFYNINGELVTSRLITYHKKIRYIIPSQNKPYYFFQDLYDIDKYKNIVITEGGFDLINLYNYCSLFNQNECFFIAIGGKQFRKIIKDLLSNYLLIGHYNFHVVLDNEKNFKYFKMIKSCQQIVQDLNPFSTIRFYIPTLLKDVSDLMLIEEIQ